MDAIIAITNCNGRNQCLHCEAPKRSQDEPLKRNEEGCGDQPQSHKPALPTNMTRASWGHYEYHNNTHPTTMTIAARASISATCVQWTQTAMFCWPAQESRVARSTWQRQLSSPSAWPTWAAQAPQQTTTVAVMTSATTRRVSPSMRTTASSPDAYTESIPITCTTSAALIRATKRANNNNNLQTETKQTKNTAAMTRAPRVTQVTIAGQAAKQVARQSQWQRLQWRKNKRKQRQQKLLFC